MKSAILLCAWLLGVAVTLAQEDRTGTSQPDGLRGTTIQNNRFRMADRGSGVRASAADDGDALGVPARGQAGGTRAGEDCPVGSLCGQDAGSCGSSQWYFYSDLEFCSPPPTTCRRVRCENFPPPGVTISEPIATIVWRGLYVDDASNGCMKPQHWFRIRFYEDDGGSPKTPDAPYYSEYLLATAREVGYPVTLCFGCNPAQQLEFTAVLAVPVSLTTGWLSIAGDGTPGCYHLWQGSNEGDNSFYQWFETDFDNTFLHITDKCDLNYCLGPATNGACCEDCSWECIDNSNEVYCDSIGGRFVPGTSCADISPRCCLALGACCHDDGTCTPNMKCYECDPYALPCEGWYCIGDLNCDGYINFGDINPFVLYLSNYDAWQATYPECSPCNGDINCDGTYGQGEFPDINPFVALMVQCGGVQPNGCPCPGPNICPPPWECMAPIGRLMQRDRTQGDYWAGPNTTCANCCTVTIPSGATLENEPNDCAPDIFNGGCNMASPLFSAITCGQTIYGESGNFGQGQRDTDWYRVSITSARMFTVTVTAEFDVRIRAYREGPDHAQPCVGYEEVATPAEPPAGTHNKCTDVVLATRCLPAAAQPGQPAYYFFVVEPALSYGVPCRADYKIKLDCTPCDPCQVSCPDGSYLEGTFYPNPPDPGYCMTDPNDLAFDPENGGCNDPNETFEPLPYSPSDPNCEGSECTFTVCGKLWAKYPARDLDWYKIDLPQSARVAWTVLTEVPVRATLLFNDVGGGVYAPPVSCDQYYYWVQTMVPACVETTWNQPTIMYEGGTYWFLIAPSEGDPANEDPIFYGYPCPMGGVDLGSDYTVTMTVVGGPRCPPDQPVGHVEPLDNPPCPTPTDWVDTYNSGCDATPPGPMQTIALNATGSPIDPNTAWRGRTGTWLSDPNDPNSMKKDYDWYKFTLTQNKRFRVLLYADFAATWEIWDPNDPNAPTGPGCTKGPAEGLDLRWPCHSVGEWTRRCYPGGAGGREYWLRIYPSRPAPCGRGYCLALTDASSCTPCGWSCTSPFPNIDDNCDDLTDYDTHAGCDDPNGPPPHFMTFNFATTYCGRIYAGLQNGAPYYDPDWFQITQTNAATKKFKFTLTTEFLAHLEVYASCADYDTGTPITGLDGYTALTGTTVCPNVVLISANNYAQNFTVYGRITCVDQLHNLLTKYYPCAKGYNRWKMVPTAVAF